MSPLLLSALNAAAALLSLGLMYYSSVNAFLAAGALSIAGFLWARKDPVFFVQAFFFLLITAGWLGLHFSIHAIPFLMPFLFAGAAGRTKDRHFVVPLSVKMFAAGTVFSAALGALSYASYFPHLSAVVAEPPWGSILLKNAWGWNCFALLTSLSGVSFLVFFSPIFEDDKSARRCLYGIFIGVGFATAIGLLQYGGCERLMGMQKFLEVGIRQYNATFLNPNVLGLSASMLLPVWLGATVKMKRPAFLWAVGPALIFLVAIANARSGFLLASISLLCWSVVATVRKQKSILIGIVASFIIGSALLIHQEHIYNGYGEHSRSYQAIRQIRGVASGKRPTSSLLSERWPLWKAGWVVFRHHPVFGVGLGNYLIKMPSYESEIELLINDNCGNMYIHLLAEQGIVGLALFLFVFASFMFRDIKQLFTKWDALETGAFMSLVGLLFTSVFAAHNLNFEINIITWFLLGLIFFSPRRREQPRS